ncbi:MAG: MarR family transcriptional regulator [Planctomycetaceae bacterium]|jgi:DNA-binding MarR family transcriptional regulator|nr:MarR family transcriptional regulator [Planctomycetaceae bacterium]
MTHPNFVGTIDLLNQASRLLSQQLSQRLKPTGLSVDKAKILAFLTNEKSLTMGELAEILVVNNPTLTKMVDRMVTDNLVYREPDSTDRRKVVIRITNAGTDLYGTVQRVIQDQQHQLDSSYQHSEELGKLLSTLVQGLRR